MKIISVLSLQGGTVLQNVLVFRVKNFYEKSILKIAMVLIENELLLLKPEFNHFVEEQAMILVTSTGKR